MEVWSGDEGRALGVDPTLVRFMLTLWTLPHGRPTRGSTLRSLGCMVRQSSKNPGDSRPVD